MNLPVNLTAVIEACNNGYFHPDLRVLYKAQYRDLVPWDKLPRWARPDLDTEGCHEG